MRRRALAVLALCGFCRGALALALEDGLSMVQVASEKKSARKAASVKEASVKEASAEAATEKEKWPWSRKTSSGKQSRSFSLAQKGDSLSLAQQEENKPYRWWPWSRASPTSAPGPMKPLSQAEADAKNAELQRATNAAHVTNLARKAAEASFQVAQRRAAEVSQTQQIAADKAKQVADGSKSSSVHAERDSGETNVDASAGVLQGAAARLSDEETNLIADGWSTYSDAEVTFSYATHCGAEHGCPNGEIPVRGEPSLREMHKNILNSLRALRFCFGDVLVILDTPHTGADLAGNASKHMRLDLAKSQKLTKLYQGGNEELHRMALNSMLQTELDMHAKSHEQTVHLESVISQYQDSVLSKVDPELLGAAVQTAKAAAELLRDHCAGYTPTWKVQLVDYASAGVKEVAKSHYSVPPSVESNMFEKMYANTMVLDQNFQAKNRYVYHMDAQYRIYRSSWSRDAPNFVQKALSLMRSDARVYMASVVSTSTLEQQQARTKGVPGAVRGSGSQERMNGLMQGWKPVTGPWNERPVRAENFVGNWNKDERPEARKMKLLRLASKGGGNIVSTRQFLMDIDRFKGLFPLSSWNHPADSMYGTNMDQQAEVVGQAYQVFFNETCGVFAGPSEPRLGPGIAG